MADNVRVEPTPIQRNQRDIALELLKINLNSERSEKRNISENELIALYNRIYANIVTIESKRVDQLQEYLQK